MLAEKCNLHVQTISNFEKDAKIPSQKTLQTIAITLQLEGIAFLEDDGVQRKASRVITYAGADGFRAFMDDVYETARTTGGEICLLNARPDNWIKWLGEEWNELHSLRMQKILNNIQFKVITKEGDYNFLGNRHAEYRWVPKKLWNEHSFYAYGNNIGFLNFEKDSIEIYVIRQKQFSDSIRFLFNLVRDQFTILPDVPHYKPHKKTPG